MYCRADAENYSPEKDTITLSLRKIVWPDKLLKIFKELENFGYSVKVMKDPTSCKKKIDLKEFERLLENQEYKEDYIIFEAKPKGVRKLFNRSLVCGYTPCMLSYLEVLNKNSVFEIKGKDSIKLLEIVGKYAIST